MNSAEGGLQGEASGDDGGVSGHRSAPRMSRRALAGLCCAVCGLVLSSTPAVALTEHVSAGSFGGEGAGEGQFSTPAGVAVDSSTDLSNPAAGDVYVVDKGNNRVERFDSTGTTFLGQFEAPPEGFTAPEGIAVDSSSSPLDPSAGDVYVVNTGHNAIDKFTSEGKFVGQLSEGVPGSAFEELSGVSVDANGFVWVEQANKQIDKYNDAVANEYVGPPSPIETAFTPKPGSGFAVDSEDSLYVLRGSRVVAKLNSSAETLIEDVSVTPQEPNGEVLADTMAVDLADNELYVGNEGSVGVYATTESASTLVERFGSGVLPQELPEGNGIAVNASSGQAYVTDPAADVVHVFNQVAVPDVTTGEATNLETEGDATLNGVVNPAGREVTSCQFEYGTEASYGQTAPCDVFPGSGTSPVSVSAAITGLAPGTTYHFRLVAGNAEGSNHGGDRTFTTLAPPKIDDESVADVASNSATLAAEINPGGADTTYRFEYGKSASYEASIPVAGGRTGPSVSDVGVSARLQTLTPGTTYHFRVVAVNVLAKAAQGKDLTFTTRSSSGGFTLPDGRAWEMVSPSNKFGAALEAISREGGLIQASESGGAISYVANAPIEAEPEGNPARELTQVLSTRSPEGWISKDIATPHDKATGVVAGEPAEYRFFSPDLSQALVDQQTFNETPLSSEASEKTPYLRNDENGSYSPLVTAGNVPAGTKFGNQVTFSDASPDLSHVVLSSEVALTAAPIAQQLSLYEWAGGQLQLVSVLPGSSNSPAPRPFLGFSGRDVRHAISNDGARVFWSAEQHLFMRDTVKRETVQIDANQGGPPPGPEQHEAQFQMASNDGSRVFFTDAERLTEDSTAKSQFPPEPDLYEYDIASGKLTDLTVDHNSGESAEVQGVVPGGDEAGTRAYAVARGVLSASENAAGEKAASGANNLYVLHANGTGWEEPRFIAQLSSEDKPDWDGNGVSGDLVGLTSRVSPSGRYLAFMSSSRLTGYDNTDAHSGHPDEEVFLYDAASGLTRCASCNPTGARPAGAFDSGAEFPGLLVDRPNLWTGQWLAANIPGWTPVDLSHAFYQSRYLSDSGRLFFNSADALAPHDINGVEDVYEYEPNGQGSCHNENGCVALMSSGASSEESAFLDASATGNDVFFLTAARLTSQEADGSLNVYDARACTIESPCLSPPGAPSLPCAGESCKAAPSMQRTSESPPTATFSGAGDLVAAPSKPAAKPAPLTRAQRLAKALKACRKIKNKKQRAACKSRAKKRYGVHKAKAKKGRARRSSGAEGTRP